MLCLRCQVSCHARLWFSGLLDFSVSLVVFSPILTLFISRLATSPALWNAAQRFSMFNEMLNSGLWCGLFGGTV